MSEGDWDVLLRRIRADQCTPFLGAGASAHILPTGTALAARWAEDLGYPLPERTDLARVAQYSALTRDSPYPKQSVAEICLEIDASAALQPGDSYDIIAGLDLSVYITTNYDDLLLHALRHKRKRPEALLCPWNEFVQGIAADTYTYVPDPSRPAVYYLHGSAAEPGSIVITEDDYLDFIVWVTKSWPAEPNASKICPAVKKAFSKNSLLFIGYSQNDWSFRVLMRSIRNTGANLGAMNIAVQLSPLDDNATEVDQERVSDYLTSYFSKIHNHNPVHLYWGTAQAFLDELKQRMAATGKA